MLRTTILEEEEMAQGLTILITFAEDMDSLPNIYAILYPLLNSACNRHSQFTKWLAEAFVKSWTPENKLDMPDFSGLNVDEEIFKTHGNWNAEVGMQCKALASPMERPRRQDCH